MNRDDPILRRFREGLVRLYGQRLRQVLLYGSSARNEETPGSDIDLLVLLDGPVDAALEIRRIWDALYPLQLESDRLISVMPADASSVRRGEYTLYRRAVSEGVAL